MNKREVYTKVLEQIKTETLTDIIAFRLRDNEPSIFESKVGGTPYVPKDVTVPKDSYGHQLRFLAQIDCENLKTLPDFPHTGLLQFFISDSEIWGLDEKDGFKIFYYENVDKTVTEEECKAKTDINEGDETYFPVNGEYGIEFSPDKMSMSMYDYRYDDLAKAKLKEIIGDDIDNDLFNEIFYDDYDEEDDEDDYEDEDDYDDEEDDYYSESKIGGYPYFTQYDPRHEESKNTVLLFQLDSEDVDGDEAVMWGDCGISNFFISPEDLKKRDFSNVLYNWDCS